MSEEEKYMQQCIDLAKKGIGNVSPNPMVGCVIVFEGKVIGQGYHQKFGQAHAEVNAINSVVDKTLLKKSTLYVNLEPCSHVGKTPPCVDLILNYQIPTVIIGSQDPNPNVSGAGIKKLKDATCNVRLGILENECIDLNKRFYTFHQKNDPILF